uniref:Secreted protein n=1 Tax=Acrobeloides nanus TaxID=290746 RepID=A0A914EEQ6_9BILA
MFKSVLISAVFLTIHGGFVSAQCPQAGITQLQNCYKPFFANFNFTFSTMAPDHEGSILNPPGPIPYPQDRFPNNLVEVELLGHQPSINRRSPISKPGVGGSDSFQYAVDYNQENWQCGPGYNDVTQNFYCLENVYGNHFGDLKTCNDQLANSFNSTDPSCKYARNR